MAEATEKTKRNANTNSNGLGTLLGRIAIACCIVLGLGMLFLVEVQAEGFLTRDARFFLERAKEYGDPPPNLQIDGLLHTDREQVLRVFEEDLGRSVYLLDLAKKRTMLLGIPWVADATVSRLWPDRVSVRIVERRPIAFVKQEGASAPLLIDASGFLMGSTPNAQFRLPVVAGVSPEVTEAKRLERMQRVDKLIRELGPKIADISEIDARDMHNLLLIRPLKGRAVTLKMGSRNFGTRYSNFLALADDLLERLPNGVVFDLRLEEQVVVAEETPAVSPAAAPPAVVPTTSVPETPKAAEKLETATTPSLVKPSAAKKDAKKSTEKKPEKKRRRNGD